MTFSKSVRSNLKALANSIFVLSDSPGVHDLAGIDLDLEIFRVELLRATKLDSKTLNDELLGKSEIVVGRKLQKDILRKERVANAFENGHFLLVGKFQLI